nr:MAG TPA: hypothetical protein [Caudoviricetes sp.]
MLRKQFLITSIPLPPIAGVALLFARKAAVTRKVALYICT